MRGAARRGGGTFGGVLSEGIEKGFWDRGRFRRKPEGVVGCPEFDAQILRKTTKIRLRFGMMVVYIGEVTASEIY